MVEKAISGLAVISKRSEYHFSIEFECVKTDGSVD